MDEAVLTFFQTSVEALDPFTETCAFQASKKRSREMVSATSASKQAKADAFWNIQPDTKLQGEDMK